jgi:hypothetical protein
VVEVEMRTQDEINLVRRKSGFGQVLQEWNPHHVPVLNATRLVVADACVHDDSPPLGFDDVGVNRNSNDAVGVRIVRVEPANRFDPIFCQSVEQEARWETNVL